MDIRYPIKNTMKITVRNRSTRNVTSKHRKMFKNRKWCVPSRHTIIKTNKQSMQATHISYSIQKRKSRYIVPYQDIYTSYQKSPRHGAVACFSMFYKTGRVVEVHSCDPHYVMYHTNSMTCCQVPFWWSSI